jgi:nucleotide-binding universal stress UspA family protein
MRPVVIVPAGAADDFRRTLLEQRCSVVCGVDGSEESELAARHAARLAEHLRIRLVLAHAYGQGVAPARAGALPPNGALTLDDEMRAGRQILERTGERIAADVDVTLRLELGEAAAAIKHVARLESAALVVTGSRGRGVGGTGQPRAG